MKLIDIYNLAVRKGIEKDPRSKAEISEELKKAKAEFRNTKGADRKAFDKERLTNPYADTRILYGEGDTDVKSIMVGIDMEGPEILAADRLRQQGEAVDLVMAHHPEGIAWSRFYDVMRLHVAMLRKLGISQEIAGRLTKERMSEVERAIAPANHFRSVDLARLLDVPFMCVHTPADNHVAGYLQKLFDRKKPLKLSQVLTILKGIPEYADGLKKNAGPKILVGDPNRKAGKIFVDMTGGTEGSKKVFPRLSQAGVGTIIAMHLSEEHFKNAKDENINIVIAGHIASDTLGLNLILDEIAKKERIKVISSSGFVRIAR